jgi:uncharacterized SAM-binding protein YcdF (DUF218 family)
MSPDETPSDLFVRDVPQPADLGLVFGNCDPELSQERARQAATLYHQGFVPRLLLSGGAGATADGAPEAEQMAREVFALGVPEAAILVEVRSRNTFENVVNSLALLHDAGLLPEIATVLLVSCPWHMQRVRLLARHVFPSSIHFLSCPHQESCTETTWPLSLDCRRFVEDELRLLARIARKR